MSQPQDPAETNGAPNEERSVQNGDSDVVEILIMKRSLFAAPPEMPTTTVWYN